MSARRGLAAVLLGALLLRLLLLLLAWRAGGPPLFDTPDSAEYLRLAGSLLEGRFERGEGPELHRTPGYPLLLAPGAALGSPRLITLPLQALLALATAGLAWRMALLLYSDRRIALGCAAACCVEPVQLAWGAKVMSETLLTCCVALFAWALLQELRAPSRRHLVCAALAVAGAAYVKPIAMFLPLWGGATLLLAGHREGRWRRALAFVGMAWLAMAPWVVRNGLGSGLWAFSSKVDRVLALSAPAALRAEREGRYFPAVRSEVGQEPRSGEEFAAARRQGLALLLSDPGPWLAVYARGLARTAFSPGAVPLLELTGHDVRRASFLVMSRGALPALGETRSGDPLVFWVTLALVPALAGYLGLPLLGLARGAFRDPCWLAVAGLAVYFLLLSGGPWGQSRFRHPVMPLLCVLAGAAVKGRPAVASRPGPVST